MHSTLSQGLCLEEPKLRHLLETPFLPLWPGSAEIFVGEGAPSAVSPHPVLSSLSSLGWPALLSGTSSHSVASPLTTGQQPARRVGQSPAQNLE